MPEKVTAQKILMLLSDGRPRSSKEIGGEIGLSRDAVESALKRLWKKSMILRTVKVQVRSEKVFKGRAGMVSNLRQYHLYLAKPPNAKSVNFQGQTFVAYSKEHMDKRAATGGRSKAMVILEFIKENRDKAFYSKELVDALKDNSVKPSDIMSNVRRFEKSGFVYVRGYRMHDRQTPFKDGYLLTWLDSEKSREQAIEDAIQRTNLVLDSKASTSPVIERIHLIRDQILEATKLRDLVGFEFIQNKLGCSPYEAEGAISRALQLYPDLKVVKLFNAYNYYYHTSMSEEDLKVAVSFKQNYVRQMKELIIPTVDRLVGFSNHEFKIDEADILLWNLVKTWREFFIQFGELLPPGVALQKGIELPEDLKKKLTESLTKTLEEEI